MQHILYLAAALQAALTGTMLVALLLWLLAGRARGQRRLQAARQLDPDLAGCFAPGLFRALPAGALATADGRAALMTALTRDGAQGRQRMDTLELKSSMAADLASNRNRIRTIARMGEARLPGTTEALEPYWTSHDPDECYFSLHYAALCARTPEQKARVAAAVQQAPLQHRMLDTGRPYTIAMALDAVCWTQVPADLRGLRTQRIRWQKGLADALWKHRALLLNPRYGRVGMLALPFFWFSELLGPLVELLGYLLLAAALLLGVAAPRRWSCSPWPTCTAWSKACWRSRQRTAPPACTPTAAACAVCCWSVLQSPWSTAP